VPVTKVHSDDFICSKIFWLSRADDGWYKAKTVYFLSIAHNTFVFGPTELGIPYSNFPNHAELCSWI